MPPPAGGDRAAIICHPHPLQGGTMNNKVITTLARVWRDAGWATVRFNFRGTGSSDGQHAHGAGEVDDLLAVMEWVRQMDVTSVALAGFSFGAWVAAAGAARMPPGLGLARLVLVAPPVQYSGFDALQVPVDTIVIQGGEDDVVDPDAVRAWADSRVVPPELIRFDDAGHFFHGRLTTLKAELAARLGVPV